MTAPTQGASRGATTRKNPALDRERHKLATRIDKALRKPMMVLGFVWLVLLVVDFTSGLSPVMSGVSYVIWGLFVAQFVLEFLITPRKKEYLKGHWLTAVALVVPALRVFSIFRAARALTTLRGTRLVRILGSVNRGMRALGSIMKRRGFGYAVSLSGMVITAGAAGMFAFERHAPGSTITSFASALWWTAMVLTTMGSDYFPKTPQGRILCFLLALYGFAVFGYVTATIASFFVARDAEEDEGDVAGAKQIVKLEKEIAAMHEKLDAIAGALSSMHRGSPSARPQSDIL